MQPSQYHIFSLPPELLATLTPRTLLTRLPTRPPSPDAADADADPTSAASKPGGPRACAVCLGKVFLDVTEQRAHFRSDWHRYNVKTRVKGGQPVSEPAFAQLLEGLDDSLSGSASSDDDDDGSDSDAVNTLINKTKHLTRSPSPSSAAQTQSGPVTALAWFHSPPSTQLGIYRAILPLHTPSENYLHELRELQTPVGEGGRTWAMFMIAGGHFAGAIVRVSRDADEEEEEEKTKKKKPKKAKPETEVLLHKTFHRYTTRRKQGGSQSTNDNAKGNAKSAGAQLRRYGEQALRDDIRGLLAEWKDSLDECERIWIRANTSNRRIFYDYEEAPFARNDERLRTFPFPTRRPTHTEIARCLNELVRPKISHYTEDELRAQDEAYLASLPKPKPVPTAPPEAEKEKEKPKPVKLSKEEEAYREKWTRLLEMVHKNRVEPLKAFVERERATFVSIDVPIPEWTGETRGTILQVAVQDGHEELVKWLLEEGGADPTIAVPSSRPGEAEEEEEQHASDASATPARAAGGRRAAYDLARTKGVRDVFRRCAAAQPTRWDWLGAGHVPSALSAEMEREQEEKKKVRRRGLKERVKEREAREREKVKDETPLHPPPPLKEVVADGGPREQATSRRLGGGSGATEGIAGLSAEMRMKVERERRARAAEARAKALGG